MHDIMSEYLTEEELASAIPTSLRTVKRWKQMRTGPAPTLIGRKTFYRVESVKTWLAGRERQAPEMTRHRSK